MAIQKGLLRIKGTLEGFIFYRSGGKDLIRGVGSLNRDRIYNDPAFERTRENMQEFSATSQVGKVLRQGLSVAGKSFRDRLFAARIVSIMREVNMRSPGQRGQRAFEITAHNYLLPGLEFNAGSPFSGVFDAPWTLTANNDRNQVWFNVADFSTGAHINAPAGATHFRLYCVIAAISNYFYNGLTRQYEPTAAVQNGLGAIATSAEIALDGMAGSTTVLSPQLPGMPVLDNAVTLVACAGIGFVQRLNGQFYPLEGGNAMAVVKVF